MDTDQTARYPVRELANMTKDVNTNHYVDATVIADLDSLRGKIRSTKGGWFPGKGVINQGRDMLTELVGEKTYMQIKIFNVTGREVAPSIAAWLEALSGCLSWPDPRIWCNHIGALAGAVRTSPVAATAMGSLAADSKMYGIFTLLPGMAFIKASLAQFDSGMSAQDIVRDYAKRHRGKAQITGYMRPIAKGDERIQTMERVARKWGIPMGRHLELAFAIEKVLIEEFDEGMNIAGYASAFFADQEFTSEEAYQILPLIVASGVTACYIDALNKPADSFLPLRCEDVEYQGKPFRKLPT